MSARSRGRANPNQDADEERRLWKEIKDKAKDVDVMVVSILAITLNNRYISSLEANVKKAVKPY